MNNPVQNQQRRTGPVGIGLIGAGMISHTYLTNLTSFPDVRVLIVGDINPVRAEAQAKAHHVERWGTPEDVLAHPDVELIVNLTIPAAHIEVATAAIDAGKHVWTEKPFGIDRESAQTFLDEAARAGLLVGVAPDTAYGPGLQIARRVIERGDIGTPLSAQTVIQYPGPRCSTRTRSSCSPPARGRCSTSARTTSLPSSTSWVRSRALRRSGPSVPDPNRLSGPVRITRPATMDSLNQDIEWIDVPVADETFSRGAGVLDLARCIRNGGTPMASGSLGYHVLDVMVSTEEAIETGRMVEVASTTDVIPQLSEGWDPYESTL